VTQPESSVLVLDPAPRNAEKALVAKVLAGDRIAARELYDAHVNRVFRLAFRLCGEEEHARELVQESFIRVFGELARFRGESALSTWVHRVTLSVVANARRRDRKHEREINFDATDPIADDTVADADPDLKEGLHAAINALPEIYRTTFVMHDLEGYTHTEIAAATGVAVGTSKGRLFIARGQLRKMLAPFRRE
jgi:RNA polymerase sigma-70 factor (ECF subfamily)